jgi:DNA invertase Pin-like site-specific DNA recombinase
VLDAARTVERAAERADRRIAGLFRGLPEADRRLEGAAARGAQEGDEAKARGREAALVVRRSKKQERQAAVRKLYPGLSTTNIAAELGCAQSTIANDVKELDLSAPVGPRRKHPKPEPRECAHPDCESASGLSTATATAAS